MGSDMMLSCFVKFDPTPDRLDSLRKDIDEMTYVPENFCHHYDLEPDSELDSFKRIAKELINEIEDFGNLRTVTEMRLPGLPCHYWFTGGLSAGDAPTEAADTMWLLGSIDIVWLTCYQWAVIDANPGLSAKQCATCGFVGLKVRELRDMLAREGVTKGALCDQLCEVEKAAAFIRQNGQTI